MLKHTSFLQHWFLKVTSRKIFRRSKLHSAWCRSRAKIVEKLLLVFILEKKVTFCETILFKRPGVINRSFDEGVDLLYTIGVCTYELHVAYCV